VNFSLGAGQQESRFVEKDGKESSMQAPSLGIFGSRKAHTPLRFLKIEQGAFEY
jgi:hypothetical protein